MGRDQIWYECKAHRRLIVGTSWQCLGPDDCMRTCCTLGAMLSMYSATCPWDDVIGTTSLVSCLQFQLLLAVSSVECSWPHSLSPQCSLGGQVDSKPCMCT